jgi:DNA replication protein DnaC
LYFTELLHHGVVINIKGNSYRLRKNNEEENIKLEQNEG